MTDKLREAAQAAYKAMIAAELSDGSKREWEAAVDGLKAALAEPAIKESLTVAEPVAWKHPDKNMVFWEDTKKVDKYHGFQPTIPLYAAPPRREWVGLTDEEIDKAWRSLDYTVPWDQHRIDIAQAIEAKLKDKNGG